MPRNPDKRRCTGHKTNGDPCPNWAIRGGTVCHAHGARARQVKRKAAANLVIQRAQRMVRLAGIDQDPIAHLLDCLHRAATLVHVWGLMCSTLDESGEAWAERTGELRGSLHYTEPTKRDYAKGAVLQVTSNEPLLGFSQSGEARIHPFVVQYENALERRAKFAKMCVDAGVSERQIQLAERMGEQLSMLFERTVSAIDGLTEAQRLQAARAYAQVVGELERPTIDGTAKDAA